MTRTVFKGGRLFDGTGADPADGDVAVEDGRIVAVGSGLDGDEAVDVEGRTILPGLFDCHVHVTVSDVDLWAAVQQPFSRQFYEAGRNLGRRSGPGSRVSGTPAAPTSGSRRPWTTGCSWARACRSR